MALVTFSSPLHNDKTVYAVAGSHTQTILSLAKENHIPIDFGCQEGDCGTCLVKVSSVDGKRRPMGGPLNVREVAALSQLGHINKAEIEQIAAGLKSRTQALAERGYDAEQVDAEIAADQAREQALGLSFGAKASAPVMPDATEDAAPENAEATTSCHAHAFVDADLFDLRHLHHRFVLKLLLK